MYSWDGILGDKVGAACVTQGSVDAPSGSYRGFIPVTCSGRYFAWVPGWPHSAIDDGPYQGCSTSRTSPPGRNGSCSTSFHTASTGLCKGGIILSCPQFPPSPSLIQLPYRVHFRPAIPSLYLNLQRRVSPNLLDCSQLP